VSQGALTWRPVGSDVTEQIETRVETRPDLAGIVRFVAGGMS